MTVSVKLPPEFERRVLSTKQRKFSHFLTGKSGEQKACSFLKRKGYRIVGQNICWKQYEVDLIVQDTKTSQVVFVEVKSRRSDFVAAYLAISRSKLNSLTLFARKFIEAHFFHFKVKLLYRIDVVTVTPTKLEHFVNVSWWL